MKLRLIDFDSNTYMDTDGSCEMCMYTGMLDHPVYTFADSEGGVHVVEGFRFDWGHLTTYDINLPVFSHWLHDAEFKEPIGLSEEFDNLSGERFWEEFLVRLIYHAEFCRNEEELNDSLDWALKGENNAD